ncbi:MAG TPA: 1-deoxy-D-xylulose-5-phosphate reductoisomerase, partial [Longimicrobiaceae bacterium]|nr:1-deoxy-D-xylulose-5-phosphate reductoisomerase [Longimicrobiaceae bacterium]
MTGIAILGATGSIGRSALAVVRQHPDRFRPVVLTAHRNAAALAGLVAEHRPALAVVADPSAASGVYPAGPTRWAAGREALLEAATHPDVDVVLNALVGAAGLEPTLAALRAGKRVALANKESLVCAGPLVMRAVEEGGGRLLPVDSEHSAIFQCLQGAEWREVERLLITASGGPFRGWEGERLAAVTPADALRHPTWDMGAKVTIDSATLANKALEVIEAHFLFGVPYDRIQAVVHPQSVIHSMVEFVDGSVLAQMGFPTMEIPVLYALAYPERLSYACRRFDPVAAGALTFEPLRADRFRAFALGVQAGRAGGTAPAVFNAANEVAVAAFLQGSLSFPGIADAIDDALARWPGGEAATLDDV